MYPLDPKSLAGLRRSHWPRLGANVFYLGLTSLLTDVSSEMVAAILPIYLVFTLGLSPLQFGLVDGLSQGAAALARLGGGLLADRCQRHREVAALGYGLSAACKLLLPAAGSAWALVSGAIALDRIGKGMRTAPRDALISLSSPSASLGLAFGVHRAFDTTGALLGPLAAFAILARLPSGYDVVFVTSFCVAVIGAAVLLCFVHNVPQTTPLATRPRRGLPAATLGLLDVPGFRATLFAGTALGLATVGDSFVFLMVQRRMSAQAAYFPLFYVATALAYLLLAIPAGRLGDRFGRTRVFLAGHVLLLLAGAALLLPQAGAAAGAASLLLLGAYYACTDGVLMALASRFVPLELRASGLAIVATANGVARLFASLLFGAIWNWRSLEFALLCFTAALMVAIAFAAWTLKRARNSE